MKILGLVVIKKLIYLRRKAKEKKFYGRTGSAFSQVKARSFDPVLRFLRQIGLVLTSLALNLT